MDFGTTNSAVACASEAGVDTTPIHRSVLYFEPKAATASGNEAIDRYLAADEKGRLIQSLKSFLASGYSPVRTFMAGSIRLKTC